MKFDLICKRMVNLFIYFRKFLNCNWSELGEFFYNLLLGKWLDLDLMEYIK